MNFNISVYGGRRRLNKQIQAHKQKNMQSKGEQARNHVAGERGKVILLKV